jgi:hypothetical protein
MKGRAERRHLSLHAAKAAVASLAVAIILIACTSATPPIAEPYQDEEYCNSLKIAGTGIIDISTSVVDRKIALEYVNILQGEGDFEMDSTTLTAQKSSNLQETINGSKMPLNLFETTRMTFQGKTPLIGFKSINSKSFYGGIGANVVESFAVTEMDREHKTFFASTAPAKSLGVPQVPAKGSPVHLVGMDSKASFNGTWTSDARMHQIFYKDIRSHESFTGKFEISRTLKFHESPIPEPVVSPCGIDC